MSRPRALVVSGPGTNRDHDVAFALDLAGASPEVVITHDLSADPARLRAAQLLVIAGGFSYGDALGAGRMLALELGHGRLGDELRAFVDAGKPVLGICNGFQALTRSGLLPGALGHNAGGSFQCRWVRLAPLSQRCIWTRGLTTELHCPIAHGEGRYVPADLDALTVNDQVALRYTAGTNPNGSTADIAGVCSADGMVLGLMPHPENAVLARQLPGRHRNGEPLPGGQTRLTTLDLFGNGVTYHEGELMHAPFTTVHLPLPDERTGKVRASYALSGDRRLFVTTDRLSAFDRIIRGVPYKGQVLNQLAAWWFEHTRDIVDNHLLSVPDPNVTIGIAATPLPVEVVVRGYITGVTSTSLWRQYDEGARVIYGYTFPDGLEKNTALPQAIITPTTKAEHGAHDEPLTCADVVDKGLVEPALWDRVQAAGLALFARGQEVAAAAGLILADTKYEFGLGPNGQLLLIDEVHTPDSSRLWEASTYEARLVTGEDPESLDKEPIRQALQAAGYKGDGEPPALDETVWTETTRRYQAAYTRISGNTFEPGEYPVEDRLTARLAAGAFA